MQFLGERTRTFGRLGNTGEVARMPAAAGVGRTLLGALVDLTDRRDAPTTQPFAKALGVSLERLGDGSHPRRDVGEVVVGALREQVEHHADVLHWGSDDVQLGVKVAGVIAVEMQLKSLRQHVCGNPFCGGADRLGAGRSYRLADHVSDLGQPIR